MDKHSPSLRVHIKNKSQGFILHPVREDFNDYSHSKLEAMYRSALFNGFQSGWKPRTIAALPAYGFGDGGYASVADGE